MAARRQPHPFVISAALALAASLASCLSPTLPLPPPEPPDTIQATGHGSFTIAGDCRAGATVTVLNDATGEGVIEADRDGDGRYQVELDAERCDRALVWETYDGDDTAARAFIVSERSPADPGDESDCR